MKLSLLLAAAFHVNADPTSVSDGTMLLGGKPFFPWGVYMQNATEDDLAYVRSAGFSTILPGFPWSCMYVSCVRRAV